MLPLYLFPMNHTFILVLTKRVLGLGNKVGVGTLVHDVHQSIRFYLKEKFGHLSGICYNLSFHFNLRGCLFG